MAKLTTGALEIGKSPAPGITLRQALRGHNDIIHHIAWSPDGKLLASPSSDKTIQIWNLHTGRSFRVLKGPDTSFLSVSWSPDSKQLVSASSDGVVRLWDITNGKLLRDLRGHNDLVHSVAWSPNSQRIASSADDARIHLWNANNGELLQTFIGHTGSVYNVIWSPNGQHLASSSEDKTIRIWNVITGKQTQIMEGHIKAIYSIAWSPDGQRIVSGSNDKTIGVWNVWSGTRKQVLEAHTSDVRGVAFSSNGSLLAATGWGNLTLIIRCNDWNILYRIQQGSNSPHRSAIFHPHLPKLVTLGEEDKVIFLWDLDLEAPLTQAPVTKSVNYTTAKLVLVGDSGVGKTGLGWRIAHGEFREHASTHGQQFWSVPQLGRNRKDGTECEAVLWDLAGQHVYRHIHSIFLDNVSLALVLFDPSNRQDPLKGAQYWLEQLKGKGQLPPTILVGARIDRGAPSLSQQELAQFCQKYRINGGYIGTSAKDGNGLNELLEKLNSQIPWDEMTATVTTATFKRIKDYVLSLKEKPDRSSVLVMPNELRRQLESFSSSEAWDFTDAEMMTAVGHLETHGYVSILRSSAGEQCILLTPDLLVSLAASIFLLADKSATELGAVNENELLQNQLSFEELRNLDPFEQQILIDAAVLRFLEHNVCFRETVNDETLLIFPSLIKQKRPLQDSIPAIEDVSYVVRGRVENLYASLVVLLGYTPSFIRINQWQNQAQYEMGPGQLCGFRLIEDREGELELVLYYGEGLLAKGREKFQELFEQFLYQREVEVTRFPPVICSNSHRIERATVVKRVREGKDFAFCEECGEKTPLPSLDKPNTIGVGASPWLQREEATARLRSAYETHLTRIKSYRRSWATPRCYLSYAPQQNKWAALLSQDLRDAGIFIVESIEQVEPQDFIIVLETSDYRRLFNTPILAVDSRLVRASFGKPTLFQLMLEGKPELHELKACSPGGFYDTTHYSVSLFNLVLNLYAIPFDHAGFAPLRQALHAQWEQSLARKNVLQNLSENVENTENTHAMQEAEVVILTILPEEYQAVCAQLSNLMPAPLRSDHANLYAWKIGQIPFGERSYSVAVGMIARAGNSNSSLATNDAIDRWKPNYIFWVGIAGGVKDVNKGDVVIADVIHGYEYGKIEHNNFIPRSNWTYKTNVGLLTGALAHTTSNWKERVKILPPQTTLTKVIAGEIASGDKVVDDPTYQLIQKVLDTWPKCIAVDMEGAGAGNAIEQAQALGKSVSYMMIRGISDVPRPAQESTETRGTAERDAWKAYASETAAAFTASLIASGLPLPPR